MSDRIEDGIAPTGITSTLAGEAQLEAPLRAAVQPVILAGGSGTRLWPLSREKHPKQLLNLVADDTLLEATAMRLEGVAARTGRPAALDAAPIVVCGEEHRFMVSDMLKRQGKRARVVSEPCGRNTAPALTVAALHALMAAGDHGDHGDHSDAVLVATPADHCVTDTEAFRNAIANAVRHAEAGAIVTLGARPTAPETGFGYIHAGAAVSPDAFLIDGFVEKPHLELAQHYVASGEYWWNCGIFVVRASVWLKAVSQLQPQMYLQCRAACEQATEGGAAQGGVYQLHREAFEACPSDSIDYAVMEKLDALPGIPGMLVPLDAGWSDVGSWAAIWDIATKDDAGNAGRGRVLFDGATSCLAHSEGRLIACVGVQDVVVVETADAVLVVDKRHVQDVKNVVQRLRTQHGAEIVNHRKVRRPWGCYDSIDHGDRFQVKRIVVDPGASLSLQMHYHRAEHWVVVRGTARVTCGDTVSLLSENQSTYIPIGTLHRLENPGKTPLEIIEVQSGAYLEEDDIVRFEDNYGRK
ncbi:mannose-1-phosphate guanylyltransferase/mannose-6-phosphate isomerase [Cupriavidus plantarum]|nr:mannose-1-phosphate guanylyltransferase/mannose-6-phosphate isomerase [Cupriavidus plantarum]NYI02231.1 mannose-1-phosphate guanylyltransferase/mannose-6-phosphate isomerase [Cupriavidus plantarum]RLK31111.1 mannose-1-phosphate guanylyltransferase/mannose-6-phosphate isomerase [Cupriavidus plantarum]CAG2146508.1 Alginate biosynthesis protein AlgA [Cupriavidus plantarum]SMR86224.1 mannose-1-phosphate guanylyltransferase / mannose-6-phosphate isomerase [Cupriavidus plantarum]